METQSYRDPSSILFQIEVGMTQRQIIAYCKAQKWPWRKVWGRVWVCSDFALRYFHGG